MGEITESIIHFAVGLGAGAIAGALAGVISFLLICSPLHAGIDVAAFVFYSVAIGVCVFTWYKVYRKLSRP